LGGNSGPGEIVRATILKDDNPVLEDVGVTLNEATDPHSQLKSWSGHFIAPRGVHFEPGEYYTLKLNDGRSGSFFVSIVNMRSGIPDSVVFVGSGDLR
jgi:hypothetical protein